MPGQVVRARATAIAHGRAINVTLSARVFLGRFVIRSASALQPLPRAMIHAAHGRVALSPRATVPVWLLRHAGVLEGVWPLRA